MRQVVTTLPVLRCLPGTRVLSWMTVLIAALALGCSVPPPGPTAEPLALRGGAAPTEPPVPAEPVRLEKNVPREEEIAAGETREHTLTLAAGDYARVAAAQTGADVALRLFDPSGQPVAEADGPSRRKAQEMVSWIAAVAGDYRLEVVGKEAGRTKVTLEDLRPSKPGDPKRMEAERDGWKADHLVALEDVASKRKALTLFETATAAAQESGDPALQVDLMDRTGAVLRSLGETEAAIAIYERALALARESGNRRGEAYTINNLAVAYNRTGDEPKALQLYEEGLRLWEKLGDVQELGTILYNLGAFHLQRGETDASLAYLNRALELRRANGGEDQALILTGIARAWLDRGDQDGALDLLRQALDFSHRLGDRHDEANVLQHMAALYLRRGELQRALELYNEALDLYRLVGERAQEGQVLSNLGTTALYLGDQERALEFYTQALELHQAIKNRSWEIYALWDIGWIYELQGKARAALQNFNLALEASRESGNLASQALALQGVGRAQIALAQPREAVSALEEALVLFRQADNSLGEINALLELGRAWQALSDADRAAGMFQQALDLCRRRKTLITEAVAQSAIARLERDRGNLPAAAHAIEEAMRIVESVRPKVAGQRLRASFFASRRDYFDFYVDLQMRMEKEEPGAGHLAVALAASERARARALLDLLAEGRIDVRQGIAPELKQRETEIAQRITWLQSRIIEDLSGRSPGSTGTAPIEAELDRSEEERERLEWQIRREHPHYAAVSHPLPLQLERIQQLLDDHTALLEYSVGQERSFLFVVTRQGLSAYPLPSGPELARSVEDLRQTLAESGRRLYGRYVAGAWSLYQSLIQPAEPLLRDKPHLIVAPDGPLLLLSFEALLTAPAPAGRGLYDHLPYLILDRSVTYVPSASVLAELGEPRPVASRPPGSKLFLGFGDPDYGALPAAPQPAPATSEEGSLSRVLQRAGLPHPQPLPESRNEVLGIARLFPADRVQLYLGPQASEERVKDNPYLRDAWRIHFAVHGFTDETKPELSGLVLSLGGDAGQDGLLQVYEIFNLQLDADLVVLSACDTGLGMNVSGEGLLGVTRALLYAGAASVVVSLWRVADTSTADLMVRFYQHLGNDDDKAEALRLSKLELIRGGRFAHPSYWAPFILIGQPGGHPPVTDPVVARQ
ncbi:MAG: CHAT domain-containing protein [Acidobacteriota bacterium]